MGPRLYMRSVVHRNVLMWRILVQLYVMERFLSIRGSVCVNVLCGKNLVIYSVTDRLYINILFGLKDLKRRSFELWDAAQ
jgi:hypothetical protein